MSLWRPRMSHTKLESFMIERRNLMSSHLAHVELQGKETTHPDIPNRNFDGSLSIEPSALVFKSDRFSLAIPWDSIEKCDWTHHSHSGLWGMYARTVTLTLFDPH